MKARYQISTAISTELKDRMQKVRKHGWTLPKIFIAGIVVAERIIKSKESLQ